MGTQKEQDGRSGGRVEEAVQACIRVGGSLTGVNTFDKFFGLWTLDFGLRKEGGYKMLFSKKENIEVKGMSCSHCEQSIVDGLAR